MNISEMIGDALTYPFKNIKALLIYLVLSIIAAFAAGSTVIGIATGTTANNLFAANAIVIVGLIISIIIFLIINGYSLDIIKFGINRSDDAPSIEIGRQVVNAIKLIIVAIVYYIVPVIIMFILGLIFKHWLSNIIGFIVAFIFGLAHTMAMCRLAKSESLVDALAIGEAIGDLSRVGIAKVIAVIIILLIIGFILIFISMLIMRVNVAVGSLILGILQIYLLFFSNRTIGLLYSDAY